MTITFVGHGYVGLVTAAVFADLGNTVWVIGHTADKIENLKKGIIPIYEPLLEEMVQRNVKAGRLRPTLDYTEAIPHSDVVFIAVGTPPKDNGEADLSVVFNVAEEVGKHLDGYTVVSVKSTVPVGTNYQVKEMIEKVKPESAQFDIASVPEFLRQGQAIPDTLHPYRVVIGTDTKQAQEKMIELHQPILHAVDNKDTHLVLSNIPTAEMIKYASNAFLATKISFANAIAQLSEKTGSDGPKVLEAVGLDSRIGNAFLYAGAGYGGSCFPKDVSALIKIADSYDYHFGLLEEVEKINKEAMNAVSQKAEKLVGDLKGKNVAILGLSFKPDTDDMRFAPSIRVIDYMLEKGAVVKAYDPIAIENAKRQFLVGRDVTYMENAYDTVTDADVVIVMTEWNEFKEMDLEKIKLLVRTPNLIDGRNMYDPEKTRELGFTYLGVGR
jgi:UDPglucose 6-dehydrogenase